MLGRISRLALLFLPLGLLASCDPAEVGPGGGDASPVVATATFEPKAGTDTAGTVTFTQTEKGVTIVASLSGLAPGKHGIHLHEKGVCSEPDFASAGDHFNPANQPHACPPETKRHAGDFGDIEIGADGTGRLELTTDLLTLDTGPNSALGRAVILHDMPDDCTSQPSGGAGARLGCAVVQRK
jgi:Cu-Zn family superoxide dismutase